MLSIGQRVKIIKFICRFPDFVVETEKMGVISIYSDKEIGILLDEPITGCHNDVLLWSLSSFESEEDMLKNFFDHCEICDIVT